MADRVVLDTKDLQRLSRLMRKAGDPSASRRAGKALREGSQLIINRAKARAAAQNVPVGDAIKATGGLRNLSLKAGPVQSKHGKSEYPLGNYEFGGYGDAGQIKGAFSHPNFWRHGSDKKSPSGRKRRVYAQTTRPFLTPAINESLQEFGDLIANSVAETITKGE